MSIDSLLDNLSKAGSYAAMSSEPKMTKATTERQRAQDKPVWAEGLKRMYNSVVDEEIPDDLVDLLKKLDQTREPE